MLRFFVLFRKRKLIIKYMIRSCFFYWSKNMKNPVTSNSRRVYVCVCVAVIVNLNFIFFHIYFHTLTNSFHHYMCSIRFILGYSFKFFFQSVNSTVVIYVKKECKIIQCSNFSSIYNVYDNYHYYMVDQ